jgi:ribosome-binding protein aMBF1 (putative translation factor)
LSIANTDIIAYTAIFVIYLYSRCAKIISIMYTTSMEVDGVKLKELRLDQALSARDLADRAGINYRTVLRLEHGQTEAQPRTVRKLAEALGVEPRELRPRRGGR